MMDAAQWLARIRLGEDTTLELKRVVMRSETKVDAPHADSLADELANFYFQILYFAIVDHHRPNPNLWQSAF